MKALRLMLLFSWDALVARNKCSCVAPQAP